MNDELPRRDAVVILSVTALIVALIVLFLSHTPGAVASPASDPEPFPMLSNSGE